MTIFVTVVAWDRSPWRRRTHETVRRSRAAGNLPNTISYNNRVGVTMARANDESLGHHRFQPPWLRLENFFSLPWNKKPAWCILLSSLILIQPSPLRVLLFLGLVGFGYLRLDEFGWVWFHPLSLDEMLSHVFLQLPLFRLSLLQPASFVGVTPEEIMNEFLQFSYGTGLAIVLVLYMYVSRTWRLQAFFFPYFLKS